VCAARGGIEQKQRKKENHHMTEQEFADWIAKTRGSLHRWTEDEIVRLNRRGAMYYLGGEDGIYLRIHADGRLEFGSYEGAVPHIGEASFTTLAERKHEDFNAAFTAAIQLGGKQFLVDMFSAGDYLRGAELGAEQNYNMAPDGLLNNIAPPKPDLTDGQTWDEVRELAPGTLPEEIQPAGEKPSLLGQLGQYRDAGASAPEGEQVIEPEPEL
jgi:hypothetical protein